MSNNLFSVSSTKGSILKVKAKIRGIRIIEGIKRLLGSCFKALSRSRR